jgi:hypothetical protein
MYIIITIFHRQADSYQFLWNPAPPAKLVTTGQKHSHLQYAVAGQSNTSP